jgi:CRP-like cAMP-binding protein
VRADDRRVSRMERLIRLRKAEVFERLGPDDLGLVADQARVRSFRQGEHLHRRGERIGAVHVVVEGRVHLWRAGRDLGYASPGTGVGGLGFLARDEDGIDAVAETDVIALELDAEALSEVLEDRSSILRVLLHEMSRRLIDLWHRAPRECQAAQTEMAAPGFGSSLVLVERMLFLRSALPFVRSSASALADLARVLVELSFEPGTVLWRRGDAARQVLLLVNGRVTCSAPIKEFRLVPPAGFPLGGLEAVAGAPRWYDATCETPVTVLSGDVEVLFDLFEDNPDVGLAYVAQIARVQLRAVEQLAGTARDTILGPLFGAGLGPAPSRLDGGS